DPRGSRCALQRHQGTGPPTRDQGSGEAPSSRPLRQARGLPRRHLRNLDTGRRVGRIDPPSAVAQLAEQWTVNPLVVGSSPTRGATLSPGATPKTPSRQAKTAKTQFLQALSRPPADLATFLVPKKPEKKPEKGQRRGQMTQQTPGPATEPTPGGE